MNLKKFNVYRNSLYFDIASGVLMYAGLIVGIIFGLNSVMSFGTNAILNTVLASLIFMVIIFVYELIRHEAYLGFTIILAIAHNLMLTTALVCIFRMQVDESLMMVMLMVCVLTTLNCFVLFANKQEFKSTTNREKLVNGMVASKFKTMIIMNAVILVVALLLILTLNASILMFIRPMLVGIVVTIYSSIFMVVPFWGYFVEEKKAKKQVNEAEIDYIK